METKHGIKAQTIALDNEVMAAKCYSLSHGASIVDGFRPIPMQFFEHSTEDYVILGHIADKRWVPAIAQWGPDIVVMSAPCPPWSNAGGSLGLDCNQGGLFAEGLGVVKLLRPNILLLENAGAFPQHPHAEFILRQIRWAGFSIKWSKTIELQNCCPVKRNRWLALAIRICNEKLTFPGIQLWGDQPKHTPRTFDAVLSSPANHDKNLEIPPEAKEMAEDYRLLPPAKRKRMNPQQVLESRCSTPDQVAPCFMASHGTQHNIKREYLQKKGLLSHFVWDPINLHAPRQWDPKEALALHAFCGAIFLPAETRETWLLIGNHIAVPHALLLMVNAYRVLKHRVGTLEMTDVMQSLHEERFQIGKLSETTCSHGVRVAMPGHEMFFFETSIADFDDATLQGALPANTQWRVDRGFQNVLSPPMETVIPPAQEDPEITELTPASCATTEIQLSATQNFVPVARGQIMRSDGMLVFWFAADVPITSILSVWAGLYQVDVHQSPDDNFSLRLIPRKMKRYKMVF
eukprot:Skav202095  [mRNA]  locus=scaffold513:221613:223166:- [translate_table: standard]